MSQAAVKPDGSDSPARKSCMFYKLMVASILQDKKLESSHDNPCLLPHEKDDGLEKILGFRPPSPNLLSSITSKNCNEYIHCNWIQSTSTASLEKPHVRTDAYNMRENFQSSRDIGTQFNGMELTSTEDGAGSIIPCITRKTRGRKRMSENSIQNVKLKSTHVRNTSETLTRRRRAVTPEEKERTIRAAHMFRSDNPFFRVILRPSYVYRGFLLHIPSSFARTFLNTVTGFVNLQVSDGKQWPVRCSFKDGKAKLGQGWTEFVWENNLEEGDVCIFELIQAKEIVLKVAVFRVLEDAAPTGQLSN